MHYQFFCEGKEIKFIQDILSFLGKDLGSCKMIKTDGWTSLPLSKNKFLENHDRGGRNVVIFDADSNPSERRKEILNYQKTLNINFELFLFPNNKNSGDFETLLLKIIRPEFSLIFECFDRYCECLQKNGTTYALPDNKSKFYAFCESTGQKRKVDKINFLDNTYYDLNHAALKPLIGFIKKVF